MLWTQRKQWWVWVAIVATVTLGQAALLQATRSANRDLPDGSELSAKAQVPSNAGNLVSLPERDDGTSVAEQSLAQLTVQITGPESFLQSTRPQVVAVLLAPDRPLSPTERRAMDQFLLGRRDFPQDIGAALLPLGGGDSRDLNSVSFLSEESYYVICLLAFPDMVLPATGARTLSNLGDYKRKYSRWWSRRRSARNQREPVMLSGIGNLIAGQGYRASFLVWMPDQREFAWTRWASAAEENRSEDAKFYFERV